MVKKFMSLSISMLDNITRWEMLFIAPCKSGMVMVRDFVFPLCLRMRLWMGLINCVWSSDLFLKVPKFFGPISVSQFPLYLCNGKVLCHSLGFSYIKNMLKDHVLKTSRLQFDSWLFCPEESLVFSRNRPLVLLQGPCSYNSHWQVPWLLIFTRFSHVPQHGVYYSGKSTENAVVYP